MRFLRTTLGILVLGQAMGCGMYPRVNPRDDRGTTPPECAGGRATILGCSPPKPDPVDRRSPADSIGRDTVKSAAGRSVVSGVVIASRILG